MSRYYEKQREERGLGSRAEQTDRAIVSLTHEVGELTAVLRSVRELLVPCRHVGPLFDTCDLCARVVARIDDALGVE